MMWTSTGIVYSVADEPTMCDLASVCYGASVSAIAKNIYTSSWRRRGRRWMLAWLLDSVSPGPTEDGDSDQ